MQFKSITAIIVLLLVVASLSVAGCTVGIPNTSSPTPTGTTPSPLADYSSFYDKQWSDRVIEKPFYKTLSNDGNDLYVGVIQNASRVGTSTVTFEHVTSQNEAANIFKNIVANAKSAGYTEMPYTPPSSYQVVGHWLGWNDVMRKHTYTQYYYGSEVNSWVVEKQVY